MTSSIYEDVFIITFSTCLGVNYISQIIYQAGHFSADCKREKKKKELQEGDDSGILLSQLFERQSF